MTIAQCGMGGGSYRIWRFLRLLRMFFGAKRAVFPQFPAKDTIFPAFAQKLRRGKPGRLRTATLQMKSADCKVAVKVPYLTQI